MNVVKGVIRWRRSIGIRHELYKAWYHTFPGRILIDRPVFVVGCGRSGTTILGLILAASRSLAYLNEPRDLWFQCYPVTDIWSANGGQRCGRLYLDRSVCRPGATAKLRRLFMVAMRLQGRDRLAVKWPPDSCRMDFVSGLFPDAIFIHIIRNGMEVARSIAKMAADGRWYGKTPYYLDELITSAHERGYTMEVDAARSDFDRGLLEWRLHVEAAQASARRLTNHPYLEVYYEKLLEDPLRICKALEEFIGIPPDQHMREYAATQVQRRSPVLDESEMTPTIELIAGELLRRLGYARGRSGTPHSEGMGRSAKSGRGTRAV